jgi:hypothetical protein
MEGIVGRVETIKPRRRPFFRLSARPHRHCCSLRSSLLALSDFAGAFFSLRPLLGFSGADVLICRARRRGRNEEGECCVRLED